MQSVRFARELHGGETGQDVEGVARALARAGFLGGLAKLMSKTPAFRRTYNASKRAAVDRARAKIKLPATGVYDQSVHTYLERLGAFDTYAAKLISGYRAPADGDNTIVPVAPTGARARVVNRGLRYHHYRAQIAYSQARPTQLRIPRETTRLDCSGLVAACMDYAGVLTSVDWRFTNTWSQIKLGRPVTLEHARAGDVVFYGTSPTNPTHEALYLGDGRVLSNGHYPMGVYPVDYRPDRVAIRDLIGDPA